MNILIQLRWAFLGLAFLCALVVGLIFWGMLPATPPVEASLWAGAPLQALGVFAMSKHMAGNGGWPAIVGYIAALFLLIAVWAALAGTAAGAGGAVYGLLIMFPAVAIAGVLQLITLIAFARRKPG